MNLVLVETEYGQPLSVSAANELREIRLQLESVFYADSHFPVQSSYQPELVPHVALVSHIEVDQPLVMPKKRRWKPDGPCLEGFS